MDHAQIKGYPVRLRIINEIFIKKRKFNFVSRCIKYNVKFFRRIIFEKDLLTFKSLDPFLWMYFPMPDFIQQFRIQYRVALYNRIVRIFKTILFIISYTQREAYFLGNHLNEIR